MTLCYRPPRRISPFLTSPFCRKKLTLCPTHVINNSGGTIASIMGVFEKVWEGGKSVMKKMDDPLLLTSSPDLFQKAGSPGGLGYDSLSKCEGDM